MNDDFFSTMSSFHNVSDYTVEEIEAAQKRKKKMGGSLADNLIAVTGRKPSPTLGLSSDIFASQQALSKTLSERIDAQSSTDAAINGLQGTLAANQRQLDEELRNLNQQLANDFGIRGTTPQGAGLAAGTYAQTTAVVPAPAVSAELSGNEALEEFNGITDVLEKEIYGQSTFLRKLVIAFKRPYVMPPEGSHPLNAILLTGPANSGKHLALETLTRELKYRHILRSPEVRRIDLGIYTDASMEKLFLQDIYSALASDSRIILFENFETCHSSYLPQVISLVTDGSFRLSERYIMQKGQLVNVQNSLASESVGELKASGKYLVFLSSKPLDKIAGIMGAPFIDALGDICESAALDTDSLRKIAEKQRDELTAKSSKQFSFLLEYDEGFLDYSVSRSERGAGLKGILDFYDTVLQILAQAKLEGDYPKDTKLTLRVENGKIFAKSETEEIDLSNYLPEGYRGEIEEIRADLDNIIGLTEVKEYILSLEEYYSVQKRREEQGLKTGEVNKHMIFTGSPGTGKTTIARIISRYLKAIGVLSGGQLVEVSRADLVGRYVGHTAPLTNKVIESAIGGVLFIDEAYSLYRGKDDTFGLEAIDTLVKGIEDHRDDLIVILAGYSIEMQEFLTANSGLKSRFPNVINFPNYTGEELLKISRCIAKSKGYIIDESVDERLTAYFNLVQLTDAAEAGNGRLARNLVEEAILNQSKRLVAEKDAELSTLLLQDFELNDEEPPKKEEE